MIAAMNGRKIRKISRSALPSHPARGCDEAYHDRGENPDANEQNADLEQPHQESQSDNVTPFIETEAPAAGGLCPFGRYLVRGEGRITRIV